MPTAIAISYFEPFGGKSTNNSELIAREICELLKGQTDLRIHPLGPIPVVYKTCLKELQRYLAELSETPKWIVLLGEAPTLTFRLERQARNLNNSLQPDNSGELRTDVTITPTAPETLQTSVPLEQALNSLPEPQRNSFTWSDDCGTYVCNHLYFETLSDPRLKLPTCFIHVPNHIDLEIRQAASVLYEFLDRLARLS